MSYGAVSNPEAAALPCSGGIAYRLSSDNQYAIIAQTEEFSSVSLGAKTWATFEKFLRAPSTICEGQWTRIRPDPDSPLFLTD